MTNEEAIKILKSKIDGSADTSYEWVEAVRMAIEALHKTEWIPVSKRLPDTDVPVLVSDGVYVWEDELQEDYDMYWWDSQCSFDFNDTAWMPRPKPYRKDDKA